MATFSAILASAAHAELTDEDWSQPALASYEKCVADKAKTLIPIGEAVRDLVDAAIYSCREERLRVSFAIMKSAERQFPNLAAEQRSPIIQETNNAVDHDIMRRVMLKLFELKAARPAQ